MEPVLDKVVVIGGGGHSKVVIDILQSAGTYEIVGFTDNSDQQRSLCGVPYLGNDGILPELLNKGVLRFIVGLGDNKVRKILFEKICTVGFMPVNAISPFAHISPHAKIGQGVVVMAGAVINPYAVIKDNVIINTLSGIDHDCIIDSHVHIAPGTSLTGCVRVCEGAFVGTGSKITPNVEIGEWSVIGAGAVVISDILPGSTVVGVPAKKIIAKG
ncbi:acetyltransferase [Paenibacillus motobuensis]|uniref:acetyltransferase n=1 Tax=Paenibacillus TaxID=44249 RepID=UPI00203DEBF5|nr:acetyltransferase [Paenibacillus lutimineralis]MCM3647953.1 acetyltransferase [Paenibacillus motobuensis]